MFERVTAEADTPNLIPRPMLAERGLLTHTPGAPRPCVCSTRALAARWSARNRGHE